MFSSAGIIAAASRNLGSPRFISGSSWGSAATANQNVLTWQHGVAAGTSLLVLVANWFTSVAFNVAANAATFNGANLTLAYRYEQGNRCIDLWMLSRPPVGTFTAQVSFGANIDRFGSATGVNLGGVNNVGVTGFAFANSNAASQSTTVAMPDKGIILSSALISNNAAGIGNITPTSPAGMAQIDTATNTSNTQGKRSSVFHSPEITGAGNVTVTNRISSAGANNTLAVVGFVP